MKTVNITTHPLATGYHLLKEKIKFTEWLAISTKNPDKDSFSISSRAAFYPSAKKLIKSYPDNKSLEISFGYGHARIIPLFSTFKGWRWNMKQIFDCINIYPIIALRTLHAYLANDYSQAIFRKIFGKHFRQFIRELNKLPVVQRFCKDKRFSKYIAFNPTPKGLTSGFIYLGNTVYGMSRYRFHTLVYPGLFMNYDDLDFNLLLSKSLWDDNIRAPHFNIRFRKNSEPEIDGVWYETAEVK